jgi:hypothetical protein
VLQGEEGEGIHGACGVEELEAGEEEKGYAGWGGVGHFRNLDGSVNRASLT